MKRFVIHWRIVAAGMILWAVLALGLVTPASADAEMRRTVVGADLTEEQIDSVYRAFGFERGTVPELRLTNAEEHAALPGPSPAFTLSSFRREAGWMSAQRISASAPLRCTAMP